VIALVWPPLRPASADDEPRLTLAGTWSATGLGESWSTGEWGEACGPKPAAQGAPGGTVQIQEVGSELSILGAGRAFSTAECWEQMPGLARTSHSASGGGRFWRTRCATGANDSRQATVVTTIQASDSSISMSETGQYQFIIKGQTCTASVTRSRSFSLIKREGESEPAPSATAAAPPPKAAPPPTPARDCDDGGGEPARLEVRPTRKLMRPGETFRFHSLVLDSEGCALGIRPTYRVLESEGSEHVAIDAAGEARVAEGAPASTIEIAAELEGKGVTLFIEIADPADYDALLAARGFNEEGEIDESAVAIIATGSIGGKGGVAEDAARARKQLFVAIVGGLAAALGLAGLVLFRRGRRSAEAARAAAKDDEPVPPPNVRLFDRELETRPMRCPVCGTRFPSGSGFCPADGSALEPDASPPSSSAPSGGAPGAPGAHPAGAGISLKTPDKICPTCGGRFGGESAFCGQDGTQLVPIN
jgi:hypothetical protein